MKNWLAILRVTTALTVLALIVVVVRDLPLDIWDYLLIAVPWLAVVLICFLVRWLETGGVAE